MIVCNTTMPLNSVHILDDVQQQKPLCGQKCVNDFIKNFVAQIFLVSKWKWDWTENVPPNNKSISDISDELAILLLLLEWYASIIHLCICLLIAIETRPKIETKTPNKKKGEKKTPLTLKIKPYPIFVNCENLWALNGQKLFPLKPLNHRRP